MTYCVSKPYFRKNNSEHLNHEISIILLEEQQLKHMLEVKETAGGRDICPTSNGNEMLLSHPSLPDPWFQAKGKLRSSDHQTYCACRSLKLHPSSLHKTSRFLPNGVGLEPSHFPLVPKWEPSTFRIVFPLSFFFNQSDRVSIQAHQAFKYPHQRMRINLIFSRTRQYFELL